MRADVDDVLGRLERFRVAFGHLYVSQAYRCRDGFQLGQWVRRRRCEYRRGCLHPRYVVLNDVAGWDWEPRHHGLVTGLARLQAYLEEYGTADVRSEYVCPDGYKLGRWVGNRHRSLWRHPWLAEILVALPGWRSTPRQKAGRESGLAHLWAHVRQYGLARPPADYVAPDGFRLGYWVCWRRSCRGKDPVLDKQLEALPGWAWSVPDAAFEARLRQFEAALRSGSVRGDKPLSGWIGHQMQAAADGRLPAERCERLRLAGVFNFATAHGIGALTVHGGSSGAIT
jgi:hypothetical protein